MQIKKDGQQPQCIEVNKKIPVQVGVSVLPFLAVTCK